MNIKTFKLVSGEEVVARLVNTHYDDTKIVVEKARVMQAVHGPNGLNIALIPWFLGCPDCEVTVYTRAIIATIAEENIPKQLLDAYLQQTTGLDLLSKM